MPSVLALLALALSLPAGPALAEAERARGGIEARPAAGEARPPDVPRGTHPIGPAGRKGALLHVPPGYDPARPAPLMVFLHGAGGDAGHALPAFADRADAAGAIVLAPSSRGPTWDVILGGFGPDVEALDRLLAEVFARHAVDPGRVAVAGFSDGASYALSLGLANGGLFTHVVAFSPGFVAPGRREGAPAVFVSHGVEDTVLPILNCSRRIVPALERGGYRVVYREFPGGHTVPAEIARDAFAWFAGSPP
jgi:predicted esterase